MTGETPTLGRHECCFVGDMAADHRPVHSLRFVVVSAVCALPLVAVWVLFLVGMRVPSWGWALALLACAGGCVSAWRELFRRVRG